MSVQSCFVALLLIAIFVTIIDASLQTPAHQLAEILHISPRHPRYDVIMANLHLEGSVFDDNALASRDATLIRLGYILRSDLSKIHSPDDLEESDTLLSPRQMNEPLRFDSLNSREFHVIMSMLYTNLCHLHPLLLASYFIIHTCHYFGAPNSIRDAIEEAFDLPMEMLNHIMTLHETSTPVYSIELLSLIKHAMQWSAIKQNTPKGDVAVALLQEFDSPTHWITPERPINFEVYWEYKFSKNLQRLRELVNTNKIFISEVPPGFYRIITVSDDGDLPCKLRDRWTLDRVSRQDAVVPAELFEQLHTASTIELQMKVIAKWKVWQMTQDYLDVAWTRPPEMFSSWRFIAGSWIQQDVFNRLLKSLWKRRGFAFFAQYIDWRVEFAQAELMPLEHQPLWHNVAMDIGRSSFHSLAQHCLSSAYMDPWELFSLYRLARYYQVIDPACLDPSIANHRGFILIAALLGNFHTDYYPFACIWSEIRQTRSLANTCTFQESAFLLKAARSIDLNIDQFLHSIKSRSLTRETHCLKKYFGIGDDPLNAFIIRKIILLYTMARDKDAANACRLCTSSSTPRSSRALLRFVQWKDEIQPSEAIPFTTFFIIHYSMTANTLPLNMAFLASLESCIFHSITRLCIQELASEEYVIEALQSLGFPAEKAAAIIDAWRNNHSLSSLLPKPVASQARLLQRESSRRYTIQSESHDSSSPETLDFQQVSSSDLNASHSSSDLINARSS